MRRIKRLPQKLTGSVHIVFSRSLQYHIPMTRMTRPGIHLAVFVTALLISFVWSTPLSALDREESATERAERILREIDDLWRADSSHGILTMRVKTRHYTRTVKMESWTKGKDQSLIRILEPKKERGVATLKSGNTVYTYLPKTDRTIRLTSSMMMGSWMGSHFTNDDLVKESRLSEDYQPEITFNGEWQGREILEFTLHPLPEAPVVWNRIIIKVRADDYLPLVSLYFDEDESLVRTLTFSRITDMGGRELPAVMRMVPAENPDEYTELIYDSLQFNVHLDDSFFSLLQLRRE
jgi:hypothetical protein